MNCMRVVEGKDEEEEGGEKPEDDKDKDEANPN